jgi:hypothetical protein
MSTRLEVHDINTRVSEWARENAYSDYYYGSRASYYQAAYIAGVITDVEYSAARSFYDRTWDFRGD